MGTPKEDAEYLIESCRIARDNEKRLNELILQVNRLADILFELSKEAQK